MSGTLYIVATPIGNLGDMTYRAVETLKEVDLIASEDTRVTGKLLKYFEIPTKQISYHDYSDEKKRSLILQKLSEGENIALVSDAGTPLINDPGYKLVWDAIAEGVIVTALPGASSVINALVLSGLPTDQFVYLGFLPQKEGKRKKELEKWMSIDSTLIFLESPYRILKSLKSVLEVLGDREVAVCREMTKKFEEIYRGRVKEAIQHFDAKSIKGEFTVVVNKT